MRFFFSFMIFLFLSPNFYPQVPNGGFEQWSNGNPVGWWTTNNAGFPAITQSTDAHSGSSAIRGDVVVGTSGNLPPLVISGIIGGHGFPISERYANLVGYYKLNVVTTENISIVAIMFKNGEGVGLGAFQFFGASVYTMFSIPINYSTIDTPDSCQISFTIGNNSGAVSLGSYFIVDDLAFDGVSTDVNDETNINPENFSLSQNYPNPFNPSTKIRYSVPSILSGESQKVILKVYNILGNEVATLVNEEQTAGTYEVNFDASGLSSGMYLYKLQSGNFAEIKKMIYLK